MKRKQPSYRDAVAWVAAEDDPAEFEPDIIAEQLTVVMIADLFNVPPEKVALDVIDKREEIFTSENVR